MVFMYMTTPNITFTIDRIKHIFNKIHEGKYDYSRFIYISAHTKGEIICSIHGSFLQSYNNHKRGAGCPKCSGRNRSREEFILKFNKIHNYKYDYSKFDYCGSHEKSMLICPIHGKFHQTPSSHLQGHGCKKCGIDSSTKLSRHSIGDFIKMSRKIHRNKYDYSHANYVNSDTKIIIECKRHGQFSQTPTNHLVGGGCKKCGCELRGISLRNTTDDFIRMSRKIHGDKYDYSRVNYHTAIDKVEIICKYHKKHFFQSPNSHLNGAGCPKCAIDKNRLLRVKTTSQIISEFIAIHGDKYDYSRVVYINAIKKVCIKCQTHGYFYQSPDKHLRRNECPKCNTSSGESKIIKFLIDNKVKYEFQKMFDDCINPRDINKVGRLKFDFYIPDKNLLIEYDGEQHFKSGANIKGRHKVTEKELEESNYRDNIKTDYANKKNITLLRIKYTDFNKIDNILADKLIL